MVPITGEPPATPLTLHETVVLLAPVTVGVKACALPKRSEAVAGVRVTLMEDGVGVGVGGGGGGWTADELVTALPQPTVNPMASRRARSTHSQARNGVGWRRPMLAFCERGRMVRRNAGEGPAENLREATAANIHLEKASQRKLIETQALPWMSARKLSRRETVKAALDDCPAPVLELGRTSLFHSRTAFGMRHFRFELLMVVRYLAQANRGT
jgi:hypothetical protein